MFLCTYLVDLHENEAADKNVTVSLEHDWLQQQENVAKLVKLSLHSFVFIIGTRTGRFF